MISELKSPFAIVAGNGRLPLDVAVAARAKGLHIVGVGHRGETDSTIERHCDAFTWVKVGQLGKVCDFLVSQGVKQVTFAGGIRRVPLLGGLGLDAKALAMIARLKSFRDDALLRGVAQELEALGMEVVSPTALVKHSLSARGLVAGPQPDAEQIRDMRLGIEVAKGLGSLDIGQTIVCHQGTVIAVEAIEGTDETLKRAGALLKGAGGVVVKFTKSGQDHRLDLPTIGPRTVSLLAELKLRALVVETERSIVLEQEETLARAARLGVSLVSVQEASELDLLCRPGSSQ